MPPRGHPARWAERKEIGDGCLRLLRRKKQTTNNRKTPARGDNLNQNLTGSVEWTSIKGVVPAPHPYVFLFFDLFRNSECCRDHNGEIENILQSSGEVSDVLKVDADEHSVGGLPALSHGDEGTEGQREEVAGDLGRSRFDFPPY